MTESLQQEMEYWVRRYLDGEVSLRPFQEWFVPRTWTVDAVGAAQAAFAYEIELDLAEYSNGHRTEEELRELLGAHLRKRGVGARQVSP